MVAEAKLFSFKNCCSQCRGCPFKYKIVSILCSAVLRLSLKNSIFKLVMLGWRWSQSRTRARTRAEEKVDLELNNFDSESFSLNFL